MGAGGETLRQARRCVRASQALAASIAGVARPTIGALEAGNREPKTSEILQLASVYRVRPELLLGGWKPSASGALRAGVAFRAARQGLLDEHDRLELDLMQEELELCHRTSLVPDVREFWPLPERCQQLRSSLGDAGLPYFDPLAALDGAGVCLRFSSLVKIDAAILGATSATACVIVVNSDQPDDRLRWSMAHELAHLALRHDGHDVDHIDLHGASRTPEDREADLFAAELLMPARAVLDAVRDLRPGDPLEENVYRMADRFLVSYAAFAVRLGSLGLIAPREVEALRTAKPTQLERKLKLKALRRGHFDAARRLPPLCQRLVAVGSLPGGWHTDFHDGWRHLRRLQAEAVLDYVRDVPAIDRADGVTQVQHAVAAWVAETYPCTW